MILYRGKDKLSWTWNRRSRSIIAKLAYEALWHDQNEVVRWWHISVWKWNIAFKVKDLVLVVT